MFESRLDLTEIKTVLVDAGNTVAGFATIALKKGTDARNDFRKRYESQIDGVRAQMLDLVDRADETATELEERFEPIVDKMIEKLPAPVESLATTLTTQGKTFRRSANDAARNLLGAEQITPEALRGATSTIVDAAVKMSAKPVKAAAKTVKAPVAKKAVAKKAVAKKAVAKTATKKAVAKNVAAKTATNKTAAKTTAKKAVAKKTK